MVDFQLGPQRIEAAVACYANILDKENLWIVLYTLKGLEQSIAILRLGPNICFNSKHPSMHWVLDVSNPAHEEVTKKLVYLAANDTELSNMWNIRLNGNATYSSGYLLLLLSVHNFLVFCGRRLDIL